MIRCARSTAGLLALGVVVLGTVGCGVNNQNQAGRNQTGQPCLFGVIGNGEQRLQQESKVGVEAKVVSLSWREYLPSQGRVNGSYVEQKRAEIARLRDSGFEVILSLGFHDTPPWVHENYPDSYYVNQLGQRYNTSGTPDAGDANLVFDPRMRGLVDSYMQRVFSDLGTDFYAVRLGGGRYGELTYPPANYTGDTNLYWAYDRNAQQQAAEAGVAGWRPGDPSPNGEAKRFVEWYLNELAGYQNWQIDTLRSARYRGRIMMLYPSWGVRPGQIAEAVGTNLDGSTSAEINGEIQRGLDFARQVHALDDDNVILTTIWLDASATGDDGRDPDHWSPVKYLSSLADSGPGHELYGENTGSGSSRDMRFSARQMERYGLIGIAWFNEEELYSGRYADLTDYSDVIESHGRCG